MAFREQPMSIAEQHKTGAIEASARAKAATRADWIDVARGLAELSVVTFHILQAMTNAGLTPVGVFDFWTPVGDMIRMPLMMLLAGLFLERSMAKGSGPFFAGKTRRVLWPFLVWAHIYALYWFLKPSAFDSRTLGDVLATAINPGSHLWFLQALFIYYVAAWFVIRERLVMAYWVAAILVLTIPLTQTWLEPRLPYLFLFFLLGVQIARLISTWGFPISRWPGLVLIAAGVALPILTDSYLGPSKYSPLAVPASLAGVLAALVIARGLVLVPLVREALVFLGRYSLEIYCAHVIFSSGTRQVLLGVFGITDFWTLFLACSLAGLVLPVGLALGLRWLGMYILFSWPEGNARLRAVFAGLRRRSMDSRQET